MKKKSIIDKIFWIPNPVHQPKGIKQWSIFFYGFMVVILIGKDAQGLEEILLRTLFVIIFFNLIPYQIYRLIRKLMGKKDDDVPKTKEKSKSKSKDHKIGFYIGRDLASFLNKIKKKDVFWIAPIVVMIIGAFDMPLGYYNLSRLVVCTGSIYFAYNFYKKKDVHLTWIFVFFAVLYNPVFKVYLYKKAIWIFVNIVTGVVFYLNKDKIK
tara:strand:- start:47 stop:676 length:630 start_codon:yes stop_codon:yes gene_type:complete